MRRILAMLLCLIVVASGWLHVAGADHVAAPAQAAMAVAGMDDPSGAACNDHATSHDLGKGCPIAGGCSFCVPLPQFVLLEVGAGIEADPAVPSRLVGTIVTPRLHPPRRSLQA